MKKRKKAIEIIDHNVSSRNGVVNRLRSVKAEDVSKILSEMKDVMTNWKKAKAGML